MAILRFSFIQTEASDIVNVLKTQEEDSQRSENARRGEIKLGTRSLVFSYYVRTLEM